ncbi:MAG: hypothetical protein MZV65_53110 [Chromatiales bacterium]|nr:hypothetical protein [Chromatiales bacterium]
MAFALCRVAGPGRRVAMLAVLPFLFHPRGLFVIEQGWTEPFIAGAFALFLGLRARRTARASGLPLPTATCCRSSSIWSTSSSTCS